MSEDLSQTENTIPTTNEELQPSQIKKRPSWKTAVSAAIVLVTTILIVFSSIAYESQRKTSDRLIQWTAPPAYTGEAPLSINEIQEAWNSNNNLVLIIIPCCDATLNDSVTAITVAAANNIRSSDKIYVGVFMLPQDDSITSPSVRLRYYSEASQLFTVTMKENVTSELIYENYVERKFFRN